MIKNVNRLRRIRVHAGVIPRPFTERVRSKLQISTDRASQQPSQAATLHCRLLSHTLRAYQLPRWVVRSFRDYMYRGSACAFREFPITPSPANPPPSSSLPHVSPARYYRFISQFPANFYKRLKGIRKTHEEGPSETPTRRPTSGLWLSQRHSRRHSSATQRTSSVPECR